MKFARILELENDEQVLLVTDYNDETDKYEIKIITDLEYCRAQIKLSFENEQNVNEILENYSLEKAKLFRSEMEKQWMQ